MLRQMVQVLKLLTVQNFIHLSENWVVLLTQDVLVDFKLLLGDHEVLVLLVNFVNQVVD
jgi:hypothetical protein